MWTLIRFALNGHDERRYRDAFEILGRAGFQVHRRPTAPPEEGCDVFPAAVVKDLFQDPEVVTRAVFEALAEARLGPVMVSGSHVGFAKRAAGSPSEAR